MSFWIRQLFLIISLQLLSAICTGVQVLEARKDHTSIPTSIIPVDVTSLHLEGNKIVNINSIPAYPQLNNLNLKDNLLTEFPDLTNVGSTLLSLQLANNDISIIASNRLNALTALTTLVLSTNGVANIPDAEGPSGTLMILDMDQNLIEHIPQVRWLFQSLNRLNLIHNRLQAIRQDDFQNMPKLRNLFLQMNRISVIEYIPTGLAYFDVKYNLIQSFPVAQGNSSVSYIRATYNTICFTPDVLAGYTSLSTLLIGFNGMGDNCIPDTPTRIPLGNMDLSANDLQHFPAWKNLGWNIYSLTLSHNGISYIHDSELDHFPNLRHLSLDNNRITELLPLWRNWPRLHEIDFSGNRIEILSLEFLESVKDCPSIMISNNRVKDVPLFCYASFDPTFTLKLQENPIQCEVGSLWAYMMDRNHIQWSVELSSDPCADRKATSKYKLGGYIPYIQPDGCNIIITSIQETDSMVECGILCSVADRCAMFGYNTQNSTYVNAPGLCALTSFGGAEILTNTSFAWYLALVGHLDYSHN